MCKALTVTQTQSVQLLPLQSHPSGDPNVAVLKLQGLNGFLQQNLKLAIQRVQARFPLCICSAYKRV